MFSKKADSTLFHLKYFLLLALFTLLTPVQPLLAAEDANPNEAKLAFETPNGRAEVTAQYISGIDRTQIPSLVEEKIQQTEAAKSTLVFSTDDPKLIETNLSNDKLPNDRYFFAPLATTKTNRLAALTKVAYEHSKKSIQSDKFGFMILTYTTLAESVVWMHTASLDHFQQSSNVAYTIALAVMFGLNKDNWSLATQPIQNKLKKLLTSLKIDSTTRMTDASVRFLGNLGLSALVYSLRVPLISMNDLIERGLQLNLFTMPMLVSTVMTAALFTWYEHIAMIKEETHPISKFIFRRVSEVRSILIGTFATTAALFNPSQFGYGSWFLLGGIGLAGATVFFKNEKIIDWLENNASLKKIYEKSIEYNSQLRQFFGLRSQCYMLFR